MTNLPIKTNFAWPMERQIHYPLISDADITGDGSQIVYVVREALLMDRHGEETSESITHLHRICAAVDGSFAESAPRQITFGPHSNYCPRWSPDGQHLAFLSNRSGRANLYVMAAAGGEARAITAYTATDITALAWSPDGKQIAFLMAEPPSDEQEKAKRAKDDPILWDVDFAFAHLFCVPFVDGVSAIQQARQITSGRFHLINFDWFPDGQRIAITHRPTPVDNDWVETRLATISATTQQDTPYALDDLTELALVSDADCQPIISPNGRWIACGTGDQPLTWAFSNRIVLYATTTGEEQRPLASTPNDISQLIGWSADGGQVIVLDQDGVDTQFWSLPITGEVGTQLTNTPFAKTPLALNHLGRIVYTSQDFHQPNILYQHSLATDETTQLIEPPLPPD